MRSLRIALLVAAIALPVMAGAGAQPASRPGEQWLPVLSWGGSSLYQAGNQRIPLKYDTVLLSLGRSVYADLQRARQAALNRETTNLQVAIREAEQTVHRLQMPAEALPLVEQLQIIRNDLKDRSKDLDQELWVPVEAEIDDVMVYAPEAVKASTHEAIHQARAATAAVDRARATQQLDIVTSSLQYSLGVFPLLKVSRDLDAAAASASLAQPDWAGVLEAVQSALATFHWYTREPARGLLSAYNNVINAYILATGPVIDNARDPEWKAVDYLMHAQSELDKIADGKALAEKAGDLASQNEPRGSDIKSLLNDIQSQIHVEQQRAEVRYWESIGPHTPE